MYTDYEIAFDGGGLWNFGNGVAKNVIFAVDNSSTYYADNRKNNFLVVGEGDTFCINRSLGELEKKFSINFSKTKTKFCLRLHYSGCNSYLFVNGK